MDWFIIRFNERAKKKEKKGFYIEMFSTFRHVADGDSPEDWLRGIFSRDLAVRRRFSCLWPKRFLSVLFT